MASGATGTGEGEGRGEWEEAVLLSSIPRLWLVLPRLLLASPEEEAPALCSMLTAKLLAPKKRVGKRIGLLHASLQEAG